MAALSVFGLSFGLPAFALVKVVLPAFYARQDTRTPVRAGVASLVANMVFNVVFLAILYRLWVPPAICSRARCWPRCRKVPGLHFALGLASALASYLNLALLWRWLRRGGRVRAPAGLGPRSSCGCWRPARRWPCAVLAGLRIGAGFHARCRSLDADRVARRAGRRRWPSVYVAAMLALGFRLRDLREH